MENPTCATCPYWHVRSDIKATLNVSGVIASGAPDPREILVGECMGRPPAPLMVPIQTLKGQGLAPQPFESMTASTRPGCSMHPDTPANALTREYMQRTIRYMEESSKHQARAMEIAEQSEQDRQRWLAEQDMHRARREALDLMLGEISGGGKA
jgi:hypothetical protein